MTRENAYRRGYRKGGENAATFLGEFVRDSGGLDFLPLMRCTACFKQITEGPFCPWCGSLGREKVEPRDR